MKSHNETLSRLASIATVMDDLVEIPVLRRRVGLDGVIGLIPGVGDVIGLVISTYFVLTAARLRVPPPVLGRMVVNILIETLVGIVPVVGDLFDFGWKANRKNLALLERSLSDPRGTRRRSTGWLLALGAGIAACATLVVWMIFAALKAVFGWLN